jgi:hypothetical protein
MMQLLFISQSSEGDIAFSCSLSPQAADGSFECGANVSGKIVGVTNEFGVVSGHRVRITRRVSATVTESYVGAIDFDDDGYGLWMTGEYSVTTQVKSCPRTGTCLTYKLTSGPLPFTGKSFYIGG